MTQEEFEAWVKTDEFKQYEITQKQLLRDQQQLKLEIDALQRHTFHYGSAIFELQEQIKYRNALDVMMENYTELYKEIEELKAKVFLKESK